MVRDSFTQITLKRDLETTWDLIIEADNQESGLGHIYADIIMGNRSQRRRHFADVNVT